MNKYKQSGKLFDFAVDPWTAPTRLQIIDDKSIIVVNNNKLIHLGYYCNSSSDVGEIVDKWEHVAFHDSTNSCGVDGLSLSPLQSVRSVMNQQSPHVVTVNSTGVLELWSVNSSMVRQSEEQQTKKARSSESTTSMTYVCHSNDGGFKNGAKGWCDVTTINAPGSSTPSLCCIASYYGKELKLYDLERGFAPVRCIPLESNVTALGQPASGTFHQCMDNLVVVAQGGTVCVYDHRQQASSGCVVREIVSQEPLWSICINDNDVLVAGADRTIYSYDARTWRSKAKFRSTCKFDIAKLMPAGTKHPFGAGEGSEVTNVITTETTYFVAGCDNELFVSDIKQIMPHSQDRKQQGNKKREEPSFSKKSPAVAAAVSDCTDTTTGLSSSAKEAPAPASYTYEVELGRNKASKSNT